MLDVGYILDEKYEVMKILGQGGMSTVYLCKNIRLGNLWAIKEVRKELKGQIDFLAEPNILKNLSHPGIPRVVDIFYEEDNLYIVEDYIEGETLQDYIKKSSFIEPQQVCKIAISICDIIEYLHSFNPPIIYRDLKPSNIMITPKDKIVLIDFGISRIYKQDGDKDTVYMGSKGYAAPEQYGTEQTCMKTDIYGLGAVIYFMVSRKAPGSLLEPLKDDSYGVDVNDGLKKIIKKAMQIDIEGRYSAIEEMKGHLLRCAVTEQDTKTLIMQNPIYYPETLIVESNNNIINSEKNNSLFKEKSIKTKFTDKSRIKDLYEIVSGNIHNNEEVAETKNTLHQGIMGFNKANSPGNKAKIKNKRMNLKGDDIDINNDELKINNIKSIDKEEVANKKQKNARNKFEKIYNGLKLNTNKSKKSFARKLAAALVCILVIAGLAYLVTDHGEKEQITSNKSIDKSTNDGTKAEDNSTNNGNSSDDKNTNQTTLNKPNPENSTVNNTTDPQNSTDNPNVEPKKESKAKTNGKGKAKHKHEEGD